MEEHLDLEDSKKQHLLRVYPKYLRLRQGSEIHYNLKLIHPPPKGKAVTIHVRVVTNKSDVTVSPSHVIVTSRNWRQSREIKIASAVDSEVRTFQIHHKICKIYDKVYTVTALLPSLFVSVLQKEATFLFGFGSGIDGQLGKSQIRNITTPSPFVYRWLHPVQISCGKAHSAIIDVHSTLYCFGLGTNGQLGQGDNNVESSHEPLCVSYLTSTHVQYVACGSNHTLCVSVENRVFAWGDNSFGQLGMGCKTTQPVGLPYWVEKLVSVRKVACGGNQSFVMTKTNVLACGSNVAGQLGLGDRIDRSSYEVIPMFRKFCAIADSFNEIDCDMWSTFKPLAEDVELSCGIYHTLALSKGRVYSWGIGDDGRLGHGDEESCFTPTLVKSLVDIPIIGIACGGSHSGVVASNRAVFTWGSGLLGQLGLGRAQCRNVPTRVCVLQNAGVAQLSFGEWHSMALCQSGTLYAWGFGEEGQLGLQDEKFELVHRIALSPVAVQLLPCTGATMVTCGGSHTFVVTERENRRQQFAQLRHQSTIQHQGEHQSMADTIPERRVSRQMSNKCQVEAKSDKLLQSQEETNKLDSVAKRKRHFPRKPESCSQPVSAALADSFSWKLRPLLSRMSVRNAFRQQNREERPVSVPLAGVLPRKSQSRWGTSPRLLRLSRQEGRRNKPEEGLAISQAIRDAVQAATADCLYHNDTNISMKTNSLDTFSSRGDRNQDSKSCKNHVRS